MPEAKNQTAAKPRTRTAKTAPATSAAAETAAPSATAETTAAETSAATANGAPKASTTSVANATSATKPAAKSAPKTTTTEAEKPVQSSQNADEPKRISVTIPLDSAVVGVAVKAATFPVTAAKKVAQNKNGIPAYVAVGGLAVLGAVEWPVAAVGGLGLAALRRWGPLKPAADQDSKKS